MVHVNYEDDFGVVVRFGNVELNLTHRSILRELIAALEGSEGNNIQVEEEHDGLTGVIEWFPFAFAIGPRDRKDLHDKLVAILPDVVFDEDED